MKKIGEVKAILNDRLLIVRSEEELTPDDQIIVFACVSGDKLKAIGIEEPIFYPKGELKVVCAQSNNMYLVERFREVQRKTKRVTVPSPFSRSFAGLAAQLQPETKEIVEETLGPWSVELNEKQIIGIKFATSVSVGDPIGRIS
jgi:hypothetical protein